PLRRRLARPQRRGARRGGAERLHLDVGVAARRAAARARRHRRRDRRGRARPGHALRHPAQRRRRALRECGRPARPERTSGRGGVAVAGGPPFGGRLPARVCNRHGQARPAACVIVQLAVDSLAAASLYALVALAVSLAFSGSGTVHLAIGQVAMAGGLTASALVTAGVPIVLAALGGLAVAAVLSG